jgi:hypothetical protein
VIFFKKTEDSGHGEMRKKLEKAFGIDKLMGHV